MAAKGTVNTTVDPNALASIIVFAGRYRDEVTNATNEIRSICRNMQEEKSLVGGDGDAIRESFKQIAEGCKNVDSSLQNILNTLNTKLTTAIAMTKGSTLGTSQEDIDKATKKAGVLKKE